MPAQTTLTSNILFPDGAKLEWSTNGTDFNDIGAIAGDTTSTLEWDESEFQTGNAGTLDKRIRNMRMTGGFTLINLNPTNIAALSGGAVTVVTTAGTTLSDIPNQTIAGSSWANMQRIALAPTTSGGTPIRFSTTPVITSVTASSSGALAENDDFFIVADSASYSGYSIQLYTGGTATVAVTESITIDYGNNDPVASKTVKCGTSSLTLTDYILRATHTDSAGLVRRLTLWSVSAGSGSLQFNFKGANADGVEEMPFTFTAKLDTARTDGDQLFTWYMDDGAA